MGGGLRILCVVGPTGLRRERGQRGITASCSGWWACQPDSIRTTWVYEERAQTGKGPPNPDQAHLCEAWFLTCASPGWLGPSLPWGRPSNQEIFRGLSIRPTSFWTASSCQTQHPVSPITLIG